jgi:hypothetical protein
VNPVADVIFLRTPVVVSPKSQPNPGRNPFELLGKSLSKRYEKVRHIPYTKNGEITDTHMAFIQKADIVILVITWVPANSETSQSGLAKTALQVCASRPFIVVCCFNGGPREIKASAFPAVMHATGFSIQDLHPISSLLLGCEILPVQLQDRGSL